MNDIQTFKVEDLPNSAFIVVNSRRRSGKSILVEFMVKKMKEAGMIDTAILYSKTGAGFKSIPYQNRFDDVKTLPNLLNNMSHLNEYNKVLTQAGNGDKKKVKLKMALVIDDFAVDLKQDKAFDFLTNLALNGRHISYPPMSIYIFLISQSLTKIPRAVRLQADVIIFSQIASRREQDLILDEAFYILDGSLQGRKEGRELYNNLATSEDYIFIVIENFREGKVKKYSDYIKVYKADIKQLKL